MNTLFRFPAAGSTAWKYQPIGSYRESDFLGIDMSVKFFQLCSQHISQHSRGKSCSIGVDQEKQRVIGILAARWEKLREQISYYRTNTEHK